MVYDGKVGEGDWGVPGLLVFSLLTFSHLLCVVWLREFI